MQESGTLIAKRQSNRKWRHYLNGQIVPEGAALELQFFDGRTYRWLLCRYEADLSARRKWPMAKFYIGLPGRDGRCAFCYIHNEENEALFRWPDAVALQRNYDQSTIGSYVDPQACSRCWRRACACKKTREAAR